MAWLKEQKERRAQYHSYRDVRHRVTKSHDDVALYFTLRYSADDHLHAHLPEDIVNREIMPRVRTYWRQRQDLDHFNHGAFIGRSPGLRLDWYWIRLTRYLDSRSWEPWENLNRAFLRRQRLHETIVRDIYPYDVRHGYRTWRRRIDEVHADLEYHCQDLTWLRKTRN